MLEVHSRTPEVSTLCCSILDCRNTLDCGTTWRKKEQGLECTHLYDDFSHTLRYCTRTPLALNMGTCTHTAVDPPSRIIHIFQV